LPAGGKGKKPSHYPTLEVLPRERRKRGGKVSMSWGEKKKRDTSYSCQGTEEGRGAFLSREGKGEADYSLRPPAARGGGGGGNLLVREKEKKRVARAIPRSRAAKGRGGKGKGFRQGGGFPAQ